MNDYFLLFRTARYLKEGEKTSQMALEGEKKAPFNWIDHKTA
jgi:hypothetical protein